MIRKSIIVVLTLATVASAYVWMASYGGHIVWRELGGTKAWAISWDGRCFFLRHVPVDAAEFFHFWDVGDDFPAWVPCVLFGTYPTLAFIRGPLRRWRRRRKGLCIDCGYDLTGNVSGVCSECGSEVEQP